MTVFQTKWDIEQPFNVTHLEAHMPTWRACNRIFLFEKHFIIVALSRYISSEQQGAPLSGLRKLEDRWALFTSRSPFGERPNAPMWAAENPRNIWGPSLGYQILKVKYDYVLWLIYGAGFRIYHQHVCLAVYGVFKYWWFSGLLDRRSWMWSFLKCPHFFTFLKRRYFRWKATTFSSWEVEMGNEKSSVLYSTFFVFLVSSRF